MPSHQQRSRIPGLTLPDSHIKHLSAPAPSPRLPSLVLPARHPHRRRIQIQSSPPRPRDLPRPSPTKGASLRRRQSSVSIMSPTELFSCRISQASKGTRVVSNSSHGSAVRVLQSRPASRTSSEEPKDVTVGTWDPPRRLALSRLCAGRNGSSSPERPTPTKKVPSPLILRAAGPPVGWIVEQSTPSPTAVPTRHDIEIRVDEEPASLYRPGTCDTDVRSSSASDGLLSVSDPAAGLGSGSDVLSPGGESFCCRGGSFDTSFLPSPSLEPVALPSPSRSFSDDFHPLPGATPLVSAQPTATDSGTFTPGTATLAKPQLPPRSRSGGHGPQSFLDLGNTPTIDRFVFRADYRPVAPVAAQEEAEVGVPKTPPPHEKHGGVEIGPSPRSKRVRSTASYQTPSKRQARTHSPSSSPGSDGARVGYTTASSSQLSLLVRNDSLGSVGAHPFVPAPPVTGAHPFASRLSYGGASPSATTPFSTFQPAKSLPSHHRSGPTHESTSTVSSAEYTTAYERNESSHLASGGWFDVMYDDLWPAPAYTESPEPRTAVPPEASSVAGQKGKEGKKRRMTRKLVKGVKSLRF